MIVFYCHAGVRSEVAALVASQFGFKNVRNYRGGAMEWFRA